MGYSADGWVNVRAFSTTSAEAASVVQSATFINIGAAKYAEVRIRWGSEANPIATAVSGGTCTGVNLAVWGRRGTTPAGEASIDKLGVLYVPISSNAAVATAPLIVELGGQWLYVTIESFVGGTSQTISGKVDARAINE